MKAARSASPSKEMPRSAPGLAHGALEVQQVLLLERVRLVVGEGAVELEEDRGQLDPHRLQDRPVDRGHAVGGVGHHLQRLAVAPLAQEGEDVVLVGLEDLAVSDLAGSGGLRQIPFLDLLLHQGDAVIAGDRPGAVAAELEAVVLRRVVARRHLHAAGRLEVADREVVHRRRREADVEHVEPGVGEPADQGGLQPHAVLAHVAADHHRIAVRAVLRVQHVLEGEADLVRDLLVELRGDDPPDVIGLEDSRHGLPLSISIRISIFKARRAAGIKPGFNPR